MSRRKHWAESFGVYGATVRVFEEKGRLFARIRGERIPERSWPDTDEDRARAKAWAQEQADLLKAEKPNAGDPVPTVARVFALYLDRESPRHSRSVQYQDERAIVMFTRFLGATRDLSRLTLDEWGRFIDARRSGAIDPRGQRVPLAPQDARSDAEQPPARKPVGPRTVEADLEWLGQVIRWACTWRDPATNRYLMPEDPTRGREFAERTPHEENPRRPVATDDRFEQVLAKAADVHPLLPVLLTVVRGTGRRIRAILALTHVDLVLAKGDQWPHGRIRWRAEEDKLGKEWLTPITADVRAALDQLPRAIGPVAVFPDVSYERASKWLRAAERLAKVEKQDGSLWHAYRRGWATARKGLPVQDVAFAGGWTHVATLETIYQQPDPASTYRAVSEPVKLREVQHEKVALTQLQHVTPTHATVIAQRAHDTFR